MLRRRREQPDDGAQGWMVAAVVGSPAEAAILIGRLASADIPAFIDREPLGAALGLSIGLGECRVVVRQAHYEAARALLATPAALDDEDDSYDELP